MNPILLVWLGLAAMPASSAPADVFVTPTVFADAAGDSSFLAAALPAPMPSAPRAYAAAPVIAPAPNMATELPTGPLWAEGALGTMESGTVRQARIAGRLALPLLRDFDTHLELAASHARSGDADPTFRSEGRLLIAGQQRGAWIGVGAHPAGGGTHTRFPLLGVGAWAKRYGITWAGGIEQTEGFILHRFVETVAHDTIVQEVARSQVEPVRLATARTSLRWSRGLFEIEPTFGIDLGTTSGPRRWAQARATIGISRRISLLMTGGTKAPERFGASEAIQRQATLGLKLTPWSPAARGAAAAFAGMRWNVRPAGNGVSMVEVYAPDAHSVELMGDFTEWTAKSMVRVSGQRWRIGLAAPPGVHHVTIRVDGGAWVPPPGLPTALDDFNGAVGVLVVE
jgi:hypothetical protein